MKGSAKELIDLLAAAKRERVKAADQWKAIGGRVAQPMYDAMLAAGVAESRAGDLRFGMSANFRKLAEAEEQVAAYLDLVIGDVDEIRHAAQSARARVGSGGFRI